MRPLRLGYRLRLRRRLRNRHRRTPLAPFRQRRALAGWATFARRSEQRDLSGRVLWRYRSRLPRRRPLYGFLPFYERLWRRIYR